MEITSITFVIFTAIVLVVYYLLPHRWQNRWLLLLSTIFYLTWTWKLAAVLIAITIVNFVLVRAIRAESGKQKVLLWGGVGFNVLVLGFFKYADFFLYEMSRLLGHIGISTGGVIALLVPVGLSYMIVEMISTLVDASRGQVDVGNNLVDFALYLAYFPKLVAGPIERARDFLPKLGQPRIVDNEAVTQGVSLIVIGSLRKLVFARPLLEAVPANLFDAPGAYPSWALATYLACYGFGLYNDFAGYTSIVRGVSGLFGIELSRNFNAPFFSLTFTDFWNRWHITLSHWLRDYVFFPVRRFLLKKNVGRNHIATIALPPLLTMFASALWHRASPSMIVWGLLHGLYQIAQYARDQLSKNALPPNKRPVYRQVISAIVVFMFVTLAWVPFLTDLAGTLNFYLTLLSAHSPDPVGFPLPVLLLLPSLLLDWFQHRKGEFFYLRWPRIIQSIFLAILMIILFLLLSTNLDVEPFIYQRF